MMHSNPPDPEVTVVICTYNRRAWLEQCMASVIAQTGVSWELCVVDDLSDDGTREWLAELHDPRLQILLSKLHGERSCARNQGLARARGKYVMFLDDDDMLHPGALNSLAAALDKHSSAVAAVGARQSWFTAENYRRRDTHPRTLQVRSLFWEFLFGWSAVSGQNLYRTALLREIGGYDSTLTFIEDRDLWLRLATRGRIALIPETVMTYRVHPVPHRPPDIFQLREMVAGKAISSLPAAEQKRGLLLRRSNSLIDQAEALFSAGRYTQGFAAVIKAVLTSPRIYVSPLIGEWIFRRLAGRIARRVCPPKLVSADSREKTVF